MLNHIPKNLLSKQIAIFDLNIPYPRLLYEKEEAKKEHEETTETDLLKIAAIVFQISALLIFLIAVVLALSGW